MSQRDTARAWTGAAVLRVLRLELLWSVAVENPRDVTSWRVRTRDGLRRLTSQERHLVLHAPPEDFHQAAEYRRLERDLEAVSGRLTKEPQ